jgi:hypothetical protein
MNIAIIGPVEILRDILCGEQQHNSHCQAWRWHDYMTNINANYLADIAERQARKRAMGIGPEGMCPR